MLDPAKWIEWIKLPPKLIFALALAFGVVDFAPATFLSALGLLDLANRFRAWFGAGFLFASAFLIAHFFAWMSTTARPWLTRRIKIRREKRDVAAYIPHMTPKERQIIGFLLAWNYKTFTAESGGGHARTLLSRGIVTVFIKHGQDYEAQNVAMTIPDHIWDVLVQHKDQFPCAKSESQPHPWRVHWQERI